MNVMPIPEHFQNSYEYLCRTMKGLKKGRAIPGCHSAGGRIVEAVAYGTPNVYERTANYSSAVGAGDLSCYAKKTHPCIMIVGGEHGGEFEGTAAVCNLFSLLETGVDLAGKPQPALLQLLQACQLIVVPCANPDGCCRVPFEGVAGMSLEEFRYYDQGTWKDGSLCGWPDCKREHPIRNVAHLGGYYNDNGINLMHDNFFEPMAEETKLLLRLAAAYAPDMILNLHGAADMGYGIYAAGYGTLRRQQAADLEAALNRRFSERGFRYILTDCAGAEPTVNLTGALAFASGALSLTWESYQGVIGREGKIPGERVYEDILEAHYMFFEEALKLAKEPYQAR